MAPQATQVFPSPVPDFSSGPSKTRCSPSTFGQNVEDVFFAANPLGIKQESAEDATLISSPRFTPRATSPYFGSFGVSQVHPRTRKPEAVTTAPEASFNTQTHALKRSRDDDDVADSLPKRRKRATSNTTQTELSEEESLLLKLKDEENLPWKDIAMRFQTDVGKTYQVPALQMRLKRLRERMRVWTERDVSDLPKSSYEEENSSPSRPTGRRARTSLSTLGAVPIRHHLHQGLSPLLCSNHTQTEKDGADTKQMLDFGATERWPAKYCARKWEELHPDCFAQIPRAAPPPHINESNVGSPELLGEESPRFDALKPYTP